MCPHFSSETLTRVLSHLFVSSSLCLFASASSSSQVPPEYGGITSPTFSVLSLRDNYLSGTLPSEWSRLHHLSQLYLDANRLSGSIPYLNPYL